MNRIRKSEKTVRMRVTKICHENDISIRKLAQLLRVYKTTLVQEKPASALLDWALRRCEEEGLGYYEQMKKNLGTFEGSAS